MVMTLHNDEIHGFNSLVNDKVNISIEKIKNMIYDNAVWTLTEIE